MTAITFAVLLVVQPAGPQPAPKTVDASKRKAIAPIPTKPHPPPPGFAEQLGIRLVPIADGEFFMGSPGSRIGAERDEKPLHTVRITQPFQLAAHEVTVGQFRRFVDSQGYKTEAESDGQGGYGWNEAKGDFEQDPKYTWRNPGFVQTDEHPVVNVSWNDAQAFCAWLTAKDGRTFRLPTEAEWEYCCRADTATRYCNGNDSEGLAKVGNVADATVKAKYPDWPWAIKASDGHVYTAPVGKFTPNAWGLYDMHGNVREWCQDWYDADYYEKSSPVAIDPQGPRQGSSVRVNRGGSWNVYPPHCRSAFRNRDFPAFLSNYLGFRVRAVRVSR